MSLVSVCIPSYNAADTIKATIQSVLDSSYENLEVIVNDDASSDDTRTIVNHFTDPRVRFYQNKYNQGVPANWNRALEKASGEFLGLLNHDDLYGPFWLTSAVHTLNKYPHIGWVASAFRIIDDKDNTIQTISHFPETGEIIRDEIFLAMATLRGLGPGFIARRNVLEAMDGCIYDENAGPSADNDLFLRLAAKAPFYYSGYPHTAWRSHTGNLTHRWKIVEQAIDGFRILNKVFNNPNLPESLKQHKLFCITAYSERVLFEANRLQKRGDLSTTKQLMQVLNENGYQDTVQI